MTSEWRSTTLGEVTTLSQGLAINSNTNHLLSLTGLPLLRIKDLIGGVAEQFINPAKAPQKALVNANDIVFTRTGQVGLVFRGREGVLHNNSFKVDPDESFLSRGYLYWFLRQSSIYDYVNQVASGSVQKDLKHDLFRQIEIDIPSVPCQKAVCLILDSLDMRIELNRKTNETLEAMAKALFKSWFVDFDPVRAKAEGRLTELPEEISDLFPDSFEDSELGEIPSGWRVGSLDQIGINPRETAKPEDMDSSDRYIGLEHMPRGSICLGESGQAEELESNKNRFRQGDLLFGKLRPYFKKTGYSQFDGVCSTDIVVVRKKGEYGVGFICCFLASDPFIDFTVAASSGTRMPRTSWKDMCEFPFAIPSKLLLCEFDKQFCHVINKITGNCIHSASLAVLRDALLPKLISGEIRIPDAEKMLEEVGV